MTGTAEITDIEDYLKGKVQKAEAAGELSELVARFNDRYAVINEAGKAMVYERVRDPILDRFVIVRIAFEDLKKLYMNRHLTVQYLTADNNNRSITKSEADWWLNHRDRRQYLNGVVFDPTDNAPADCWNLWSGYSVEPAPGDWSLMRDHIRNVVCAGNEERSEYLLNWIARMFQRPNQPGEVAIVLRGLKGVGKGIVFNWIVRAWGQHGLRIGHAAHLVGTFNDHLRDCVALFADEAFYAGDKKHEGILKGLITEPTMAVEGKYKTVVMVRNMLHVMMASNSDWVVPATHDERRYFVLDVPDVRKGDRRYFADIAAQMENGGLAAMIHDSLSPDISAFEVRDYPDTEALAEQKKHSLDSLDSLDRWWLTVLERGFVWVSRHGASDFRRWRPFCATELLHRSYLQWCAHNRVGYPKSRVQLGKRMSEMYQGQRAAKDEIIGEVEAPGGLEDELSVVWADRPTGYLVDDLDQARFRFAEVRGVVGDWENAA